VLHLALPEKETPFLDWLEQRGKAHFNRKVAKSVRQQAAAMVWRDRQDALGEGLPVPGLAEYLDLLRALAALGTNAAGQQAILGKISQFALVKHKEQPVIEEEPDPEAGDADA
jgi:UDP-N-acetylmuramoylalanine-D-glutamate ligase